MKIVLDTNIVVSGLLQSQFSVLVLARSGARASVSARC
jgi:predicted nucleic acid-binding protein